mmetsp:Transcript_38433/g.38785  ORF Transcript_38433/g.38785 Transcript_38433/m.38785 type:complete len:212 (-) Transcript_38433:1011-1646(-)
MRSRRYLKSSKQRREKDARKQQKTWQGCATTHHRRWYLLLFLFVSVLSQLLLLYYYNNNKAVMIHSIQQQIPRRRRRMTTTTPKAEHIPVATATASTTTTTTTYSKILTASFTSIHRRPERPFLFCDEIDSRAVHSKIDFTCFGVFGGGIWSWMDKSRTRKISIPLTQRHPFWDHPQHRGNVCGNTLNCHHSIQNTTARTQDAIVGSNKTR